MTYGHRPLGSWSRKRRGPTSLMSTAFVLSGGASLERMQAGMLSALYERGISPDVLVGTSVGAVNAAFIASRPPTVDTADELQEIWRGLEQDQGSDFSRQSAFLCRARSLLACATTRCQWTRSTGTRSASRNRPSGGRANPAARGRGRRLTRGGGPAVNRTRDRCGARQCRIPGVFPPVPRDARMLVDGGILNNTRSRTRSLWAPSASLYYRPSGPDR